MIGSLTYDTLTLHYEISGDLITANWKAQNEDHTLQMVRTLQNIYVIHIINGHTYYIRGYPDIHDAINSELKFQIIRLHSLGV